MKTAIFQAIIDKLRKDATLTGYLGTNKVFRIKNLAPAQIPCITVGENSERSTPRPGYNTTKVRDNTPTIQVDIWVSSADESFPCTGEDADQIAEQVDKVLLDSTSPVAGTLAGSWVKASSSQQHDYETSIWHNALRFSFQYQVTD